MHLGIEILVASTQQSLLVEQQAPGSFREAQVQKRRTYLQSGLRVQKRNREKQVKHVYRGNGTAKEDEEEAETEDMKAAGAIAWLLSNTSRSTTGEMQSVFVKRA